MTVAHEATTNGSGTANPTLTFSHTTSGANRYLKVVTGTNSGSAGNISGVTFNGVALTFLDRQSTSPTSPYGQTEYWYLINPPLGTFDVVVTHANPPEVTVAKASTYSGVHQTTPHGTSAKATGATTTPTVNVSSASGELVVDGCINVDAGFTATGAGQTARGADATFGTNPDIALRASDEAGAGTVTMSYTTASSTYGWATIAVPLKPAGSTTFTIDEVGTIGLTGALGLTGDIQIRKVFNVEQVGSIALAGTLQLTGDLTFHQHRWRVPSNLPPGTSVYMIVFSGASPAYAIHAQGAATVDASGNVDLPGDGFALGTAAFAFVHNFDGNTATTSISGGPCIATLIDTGA